MMMQGMLQGHRLQISYIREPERRETEKRETGKNENGKKNGNQIWVGKKEMEKTETTSDCKLQYNIV